MTITRIITIEDLEPFRKIVRSILAERPDLLLLAEFQDGSAALQRCADLQPDVALLDIGLPGLNGFEVARRIKECVPSCRIVFLTQEDSADMIEHALTLGAAAYVIKAHTASDLIPAILAARAGRQFVSSRISSKVGGVRSLPARGGVPEKTLSIFEVARDHDAHVYEDDQSLVEGIAFFVKRCLAAGKPVIALVAAHHRTEAIQFLHLNGVDTNAALKDSRLMILDAGEFLTQFMTDDRVDSARLWALASSLIETLRGQNPGAVVCACGECASTLCMRGNIDAAMEVERIWDELARKYGMPVFCVYFRENIDPEQDRETCRRIRATHDLTVGC